MSGRVQWMEGLRSSVLLGIVFCLCFGSVYPATASFDYSMLSDDDIDNMNWDVAKMGLTVENVSSVSNFQDELDLLDLNHGEVLTASNNSSASRRQLRSCDYTNGQWVFDPRRKVYSGACKWIRSAFKCQANGRKDSGYYRQSWRPYGCPLPRFNPDYFVKLFRNKIVGFIGDSFTRNFQQSITCLLGAKYPIVPFSSWIGDRQIQGVKLPNFNIKIIVIVSPYLVQYTNAKWAFQRYGLRPGSGDEYVVWLDEIDPSWKHVFKSVDLTIFMSGHWFLNTQGSTNVRGSTYIKNGRVVRLSWQQAYLMMLNKIKHYVQITTDYKGVPMFLTYSPSHYTKGYPPYCNHRTPMTSYQVGFYQRRDISTKFRTIEVAVFRNSRFRVIDITKLSSYRQDAHVMRSYGSFKNSKVKFDCTHWCLPGVPDAWSDVFQYVLRTQLRRARV